MTARCTGSYFARNARYFGSDAELVAMVLPSADAGNRPVPTCRRFEHHIMREVAFCDAAPPPPPPPLSKRATSVVGCGGTTTS